MKSAKEMFEELGYKLTFYHTKPKEVECYQFIYECNENSPRRIEFRKDNLGTCLYISYEGLFEGIYHNRLPFKILNAINKQVEELGWNNEKTRQFYR